MIKFFRRIRQKLLSENRFSKYLIYALGEIVLVVIGILIALQINNWNQEQQTAEVLNQFVSEFKKEVYSSLKVEKPTDGSFKPRTCHFPMDYDEEYFKQLTSEKQVLVNSRDGGVKIAWQKDPTVRNEALDVRVYARAAAHIMGLDDPGKNWKSLEAKASNKTSSSISSGNSKDIQDIIKQNQLNTSFM
jgi:phage terminase large subunit GpA-like protein